MAGAVVLIVAGCTSGSAPSASAIKTTPADASVAPTSAGSAGEPATLGIAHYHRWSTHLGQGGQPDGDQGFATLQSLGFTTLLSVDGAMPDVEGAARHGLHYVHIPVGYDGITPDEQARIVKAVELSEGPVFVHCHHGLHRGPAAAAIARMGTEGVTPEVAHAGLKDSGCSADYFGLYRDVLGFHAPDAATLAALPPLPSVVRPQGVQAAMVEIDAGWDLIKACKDSAWKTPASHPDVVPVHEVTILRERLHELGRQDEAAAHGADFLAHLATAESAAVALEAAAGRDPAAADESFVQLKNACASCHATYRDQH